MALETLNARLGRVMYHKPSKFSPAGDKYLIARTSTGETVKGFMQEPIEGEQYCFYGERKAQNGGYEAAFEFSTFEVIIDRSDEGLAQYLVRYVKGIGLAKARAIVEHFGGDTLAILEADPTRVHEAAASGGVRITAADTAAISEHFNDPRRVDPVAYAGLVVLFQGHRIPRAVIEDLARTWKGSAVSVVKGKPYSILLDYPRMGWKTVDALATTNLEYAPDGLDRQQAAILEALTVISNEGHTYATDVDAEAEAFRLIQMRPSDEAWAAVIDDEKVVARDGPQGEEVALKSLALAEETIAQQIARLSAAGESLESSLFTAEELVASGLNEEQRAAVEMIENNAVCLLVGPPGTGKSYTVASVIGALVEQGVVGIQVVAPTGKAAKRAAELIEKATGRRAALVPCSTIHKALSPTPSEAESGTPAASAKFGRGRDEFGFSKNEANPIEAVWLFIDETSMVDVRLGASLLKAIALGTRVVFIGDENQLPSVGPGSMLRDLIAAGLPRVTLEKIVRSDGGGRVVKACHSIKDGRRPEPAGRISLPTENWVHIEHDDPAEIAREIVELFRPTKTFADPIWDIQAISPQRNTAMGCDALNRLLAERLNPQPGGGGAEADAERPQFRIGDKVVRLQNGKVEELHAAGSVRRVAAEDDDLKTYAWQGTTYLIQPTAVVNGDMGTVLDIAPHSKGAWAIVRFRYPDRLCRISMAESHLAMAYALTCHKSQGSGFPLVIVPVHNSFFFDDRRGVGVWSRELAYTAISRAEKLLITVGQFAAIETAIRRKTVHRRRTRLVERLNEVMPELSENKEVPW